MTLPKGSLSYTRGHLGYAPQTTTAASDLCPVGSDCARAAILAVRERLAAAEKTTYSIKRKPGVKRDDDHGVRGDDR